MEEGEIREIKVGAEERKRRYKESRRGDNWRKEDKGSEGRGGTGR